jgi:hypothetical protein
MHGILHKNKQLARKEELEKKQTITSLAINSIKNIVRVSKPKTEDELSTLADPVTSSVKWKLVILLCFTLFVCFWFIMRLFTSDNDMTEDPSIQLQAELAQLKATVDTHAGLIATLRRDLISGLKELGSHNS